MRRPRVQAGCLQSTPQICHAVPCRLWLQLCLHGASLCTVAHRRINQTGDQGVVVQDAAVMSAVETQVDFGNHRVGALSERCFGRRLAQP